MEFDLEKFRQPQKWKCKTATETPGSQNSLPDVNLAIKNSYRSRIWLSDIITRHLTQAEHIHVHNAEASEKKSGFNF